MKSTNSIGKTTRAATALLLVLGCSSSASDVATSALDAGVTDAEVVKDAGPTDASVDSGSPMKDAGPDASEPTECPAGTAGTPPARQHHAMAYDPVCHRVVMFGGSSGSEEFDDTWVWNGTRWSRLSPDLSPSRRTMMALAPSSGTGHLIGAPATVDGNDIAGWAFKGATWAKVSSTEVPERRDANVLVFDAEHAQTVLFGGVGALWYKDTWVWDGSTWTKKSPSQSPPATCQAASAYDAKRKRVLMFGGSVELDPNVESPGKATDVWAWDGSNWEMVTPPGDIPTGRFGARMAYDKVNERVILFGVTITAKEAETWALDDKGWTKLTPAHSPSPRVSASMTTDEERNRIVLFGGNHYVGWGLPEEFYGDTWEWTGADWERR